MKFLIILSILIGSAYTTAEDTCGAEIIRIRNELIAHINDDKFDYLDSYHQLKKLHAAEITEEEFGTFVDGFCPKAIAWTKYGLDQIPTISEGCVTDPTVNLKKNTLKFANVWYGKYCSDSGKGYKDIVKNKGTNCFFGNEEYKECFKTHNMKHYLEENFKDENFCNYIKVHFDCDNLLDKCENADVKTLQLEVNRDLKEQMKCTFD